MVSQRKTLTDIFNTMKKSLYMPIAIATLGLVSYVPSYAQATRTTETENFDDGTISRSSLAQPSDKWYLRNQRLESDDFGRASGDTRLHFNNGLYSFESLNLCISVEIDRTLWPFSDRAGLIIAGDPTQGDNGTYFEFSIRATSDRPPRFFILRKSPGWNHTYMHSDSRLIIPEGINKLTVSYRNGRYNFFLNNTQIDTTVKVKDGKTGKITIVDLVGQMPSLEGYIGCTNRDSSAGNDLTSVTCYDNFTIEYDDPKGAGGRIKKKLGIGGGLEAHVPDIFVRGDSDMNGTVNLTDAIYTLNSMFRSGKPLQCHDAADINDDGRINIADPVYTLLHLFRGAFIRPPHAGGPGMDLTYDGLRCENGLAL